MQGKCTNSNQNSEFWREKNTELPWMCTFSQPCHLLRYLLVADGMFMYAITARQPVSNGHSGIGSIVFMSV